MINARMLAYQILLHLEQNPSHPDRLIRAVLNRHSRLDDRDRALMTEIVYGVLRWQGRLDWHIDKLSKVKPRRIDPAIRILLRLALYQILFLDRVPPHAAVNETVKMVKATQPLHLAGFVNALLREAIRRGAAWEWPIPEEAPAEYLAVTTSHPLWFTRRCIQERGFDEAKELCVGNNSIAPLVLRVNPLKVSTSELVAALKENGVEAEPSPFSLHSLRVHALRQDVTKLPAYEKGWFQVQDEASQLVSHLVSARPGERILDLCAGFGGKSTHLGVLMENKGEILAVDHTAWKLEELAKNAHRQGIGIINTLAGDILDLEPHQLGTFDRVLLDAPCSGFGTLRRKPDIKWQRHPKDPYRFSQLQAKLLEHASSFVKSGGILVYATCTIFAEEDEDVAKKFTESHPHWAAEDAAGFLPAECRAMVEGTYFRSWPHRNGTDGFFGARWHKGD